MNKQQFDKQIRRELELQLNQIDHQRYMYRIDKGPMKRDIVDRIKDRGLWDGDMVIKEMELISKRKSGLSSKERQFVQSLYLLCYNRAKMIKGTINVISKVDHIADPGPIFNKEGIYQMDIVNTNPIQYRFVQGVNEFLIDEKYVNENFDREDSK